MDRDEMRQLLWSVSDSYDDFVEGMFAFHGKSPEQMEALKQYVLQHPEAHTDDIIEYMDQFLDLYNFEKEGYPEPPPTATAAASVMA